MLWRQVHPASVDGRNRVLNKADWVSDHKHGASCEFPPSIGAFSRPGAPQPSGDRQWTVCRDDGEAERAARTG